MYVVGERIECQRYVDVCELYGIKGIVTIGIEKGKLVILRVGVNAYLACSGHDDEQYTCTPINQLLVICWNNVFKEYQKTV